MIVNSMLKRIPGIEAAYRVTEVTRADESRISTLRRVDNPSVKSETVSPVRPQIGYSVFQAVKASVRAGETVV